MSLLDSKYYPILMSRPGLAPRYLGLRLREALAKRPEGICLRLFGNVKLPLDLRHHALMAKYYYGTHEYYLREVFRQHLMGGDIFIDIGANAGYWSAFAADLIGEKGEVHCFEPVGWLNDNLQKFKQFNPGRNIIINRTACSDKRAELTMDVVDPTADNFDNLDKNIGSSTLVQGLISSDISHRETVQAIRFDDYIEEKQMNVAAIGLIKIDVEGHELACLKGMENLLSRTGRKVPILCEISTDTDIDIRLDGRLVIDYITDHGYRMMNARTLRPINLDALDFNEDILFY